MVQLGQVTWLGTVRLLLEVLCMWSVPLVKGPRGDLPVCLMAAFQLSNVKEPTQTLAEQQDAASVGSSMPSIGLSLPGTPELAPLRRPGLDIWW